MLESAGCLLVSPGRCASLQKCYSFGHYQTGRIRCQCHLSPMTSTRTRVVALAIVAMACSSPSQQREAVIAAQDPSGVRRLPTGARLDPAGVSHDLGPL